MSQALMREEWPDWEPIEEAELRRARRAAARRDDGRRFVRGESLDATAVEAGARRTVDIQGRPERPLQLAPRPASLPSEQALVPSADDAPARRTVRITGQTSARSISRPATGLGSRVAARPDRPARWAVALGLFMVFMAVVTGDAGAATL